MGKKISYKGIEDLKRACCEDCCIRESQGCKETDPLRCKVFVAMVTSNIDNGYRVEVGKFILAPSKPNELLQFLEFSDDNLDLIRDMLANDMLDGRTASFDDEVLEVINVCQSKLLCPTFKSVEQFKRNKSNSWNEIEEGGEQ